MEVLLGGRGGRGVPPGPGSEGCVCVRGGGGVTCRPSAALPVWGMAGLDVGRRGLSPAGVGFSCGTREVGCGRENACGKAA